MSTGQTASSFGEELGWQMKGDSGSLASAKFGGPGPAASPNRVTAANKNKPSFHEYVMSYS